MGTRKPSTQNNSGKETRASTKCQKQRSSTCTFVWGPQFRCDYYSERSGSRFEICMCPQTFYSRFPILRKSLSHGRALLGLHLFQQLAGSHVEDVVSYAGSGSGHCGASIKVRVCSGSADAATLKRIGMCTATQKGGHERHRVARSEHLKGVVESELETSQFFQVQVQFPSYIRQGSTGISLYRYQ
jgi:hypothetical protein